MKPALFSLERLKEITVLAKSNPEEFSRASEEIKLTGLQKFGEKYKISPKEFSLLIMLTAFSFQIEKRYKDGETDETIMPSIESLAKKLDFPVDKFYDWVKEQF